jgi:hypothetical protein
MNYLIQLVQDISLRICTEVLCRSLLAVEFNSKDHYVDAVEFYSKDERRLSLLYFFLLNLICRFDTVRICTKDAPAKLIHS